MLKRSWFKVKRAERLSINRRNSQMRENDSTVSKSTPNWIPSKKCEEKTMKSYSLDFTQDQDRSVEKVYVMNVSFILKGRFILTVQRRTIDFGNSTFQVVLWDGKEVKQKIESKRESQQQLVITMNDSAECRNQCFDLGFSEIHQVCVSEGRKLIIVGRTNKDNEVIEQLHFSFKGDGKKVRMKTEFILSLTTRRLIVKKKNSVPIFRGVQFPDTMNAAVSALITEGDLTSFIYQISSMFENRWVVCLYNSQAKRSTQQFQFIELSSDIIRGTISSACFLQNESKLIVVTTAFQMLTFDMGKIGLSLRNIRLLGEETLLFDHQYEQIHLQKIKYVCPDTNVNKELIIACSTSGRLFFVPESLNSFNTEIHSLDVSTGIDADGEILYVEQFTSCDFTKQCVLTCRSGRVFTFDIFRKLVVQKTNINTEINSNFPCDIGAGFYYQLIDLNWFGDELYHLQDNILNVHLMKPNQTLLEESSTKVLEHLPVEDIIRSNISSYVKRIIS